MRPQRLAPQCQTPQRTDAGGQPMCPACRCAAACCRGGGGALRPSTPAQASLTHPRAAVASPGHGPRCCGPSPGARGAAGAAGTHALNPQGSW